ncbi:MAG: hypothetical protein IJP03_01205, partial [Christensenellaceae bacterium]|nr:hypothetical protein [Christensenellaceae bacterium]
MKRTPVKRLVGLMLSFLLVFALLPTAALAATEVELADMLQAIEGGAESGEGWSFSYGVLQISASCTVVDSKGASCPYSVYNIGTIKGGTYTKPISNLGGTIEGGTFDNDGHIGNVLLNDMEGTIKGGTFYCDVQNGNQGSVSGGTFYGQAVLAGGQVTGGTFKVDTYALSNVTLSSDMATYGQIYSVTLSPAANYALPESIEVAVNSLPLADGAFSYDKNTGALSIPAEKVTGPVSLSGTALIENYALWVAGVQFSADNLYIDSTDVAGLSGSASFDPASNELILNGFSYTGPGHSFTDLMGDASSAAIYSDLDALT